jgi:prophage tail gpP-like protein
VVDWRAGDDAQLWRPNQLVTVYDPFAGIDDDMLISEVEYIWDEHGASTVIHVVGKTAFDRVNEPARQQPRHRSRGLS